MRQLYLLGALDAAGALTPLGVRMARLPLEPSLARTLLAAEEYDCIPAAATMCAMASGEEPYCRAGRVELLERAAETRERLDGPDGDYISLLRLYTEWEATAAHQRDEWCLACGVRARVLRTAHDVKQQLLGLVKTAGLRTKGVGTARDGQEGGSADAVDESARCRRALAEAYFFHTAKRMRGTAVYQTLTHPPQTVALHANTPVGDGGSRAASTGARPASGARPGHGGSRRLFGADYVVFNELTWAGKAVMQLACAVEWAWVAPLLPRMELVNVEQLLGGTTQTTDSGADAESAPTTHKRDRADEGDQASERRNGEDAVSAARQRYLQRRAATGASTAARGQGR